MIDETRPRHYAEEIGNAMREVYNRMILDVPAELRPMVEDHVFNGLKIENSIKRAKEGGAQARNVRIDL